MVQDYRLEVPPKMRMAHQWGYLSAEGVLKHSIQVLELDLMPRAIMREDTLRNITCWKLDVAD